MLKPWFLFFILQCFVQLSLSTTVFAQNSTSTSGDPQPQTFALPAVAEEEPVEAFETPRFKPTLKGYMTYRQFQAFENVAVTEPFWKKETDLRAFELKGEYYLSPKSEIEFEIEFEHGGTGSSLEYDALEEFGEFEAEHEKGGEVVLSEFYYRHALDNQTWIKVGKIPVYLSLGNVQENYLLHPTVLSVSSEQSMLPSEWRELGVEVQKRFGGSNIRVSVMNGLNSEFFRKYNWIGGGFQKQFETSNSGSLAGTVSYEYGDVALDDGIVASVYYGEVTGNRYKKRKLNNEANVIIASLFGAWRTNIFGQGFGFRGEFIHGTLSRSDEISLANATLTASANPGAFAPLGATAQLEMAEISYDIYESDTEKLTAYYSYQHVDTMKAVQGSILKDDRYNKVTSSFGFMQKWQKIMFVKAEFANHSNAQPGLPSTSEYQLALGFDWNGFNL